MDGLRPSPTTNREQATSRTSKADTRASHHLIAILAVLIGMAGSAMAATPDRAVHAVVFLDLLPNEAGSVCHTVRWTRRDPALRSVLLVEQDSIANHYTFVQT